MKVTAIILIEDENGNLDRFEERIERKGVENGSDIVREMGCRTHDKFIEISNRLG